jgi:hypothetical protein
MSPFFKHWRHGTLNGFISPFYPPPLHLLHEGGGVGGGCNEFVDAMNQTSFNTTQPGTDIFDATQLANHSNVSNEDGYLNASRQSNDDDDDDDTHHDNNQVGFVEEPVDLKTTTTVDQDEILSNNTSVSIGKCDLFTWRLLQHKDATRLQFYCLNFIIRLRYHYASLRRRARLELAREDEVRRAEDMERKKVRAIMLEEKRLKKIEKRNNKAIIIQVIFFVF